MSLLSKGSYRKLDTSEPNLIFITILFYNFVINRLLILNNDIKKNKKIKQTIEFSKMDILIKFNGLQHSYRLGVQRNLVRIKNYQFRQDRLQNLNAESRLQWVEKLDVRNSEGQRSYNIIYVKLMYKELFRASVTIVTSEYCAENSVSIYGYN